jgi:tripartite-type tricarboxylate transporter receptor subunit TctC
MLKDVAKKSVVRIPCKGNAPADIAILANEVQSVFGSMPALLWNVKGNRRHRELAAMIRAAVDRYTRVAKAVGIKLD